MFVRWDRKEKRRSVSNLGDLYVCRLVEACRVDGKPRQKVIAYLGAIRTAMPTNHRIVFWSNVNMNLDRLDLPDDVRATIVGKIGERVPFEPPSNWQKTLN